MQTQFSGLRSSAPFWSLRYHDEKRETLSVRQDIVEPPRLSHDRGAMLTAVTEGGYGYCATSDLSPAGLQAALDRASEWAHATSGKSVVRFDPKRLPAPRGNYASPEGTQRFSRKELLDLLTQECARARIDERIVERCTTLELVDDERLYLTSNGGKVRQRFRFTVPTTYVAANQGMETQVRSLQHAQQGGFEMIERSGFAGSGARVADEALQLLLAPNCPSGRMDLLLMPDQMMLQIHESIGHPLELDRILGDERNYAGTSFVRPAMFGSYQYGSKLLNVTYDPTRPEQMASFAFDDEGAASAKTWLIKDGILVAPLGG